MKLRYKCFNSSEDFEKWQDDNAPVKLHMIAPLITELDMKIQGDEEGTSGVGNAKTNVSCFVVYFDGCDK